MKIERKNPEKAFEPITITLETEKEAALIGLLFSYCDTIPRAIEKEYPKRDREKMRRAIIDTRLDARLYDEGISYDLRDKHFNK